MTISLYKHNQKAFENTLKLLEKENRVAIIHPTGSGKSFIVFKLVEYFKDAKFLWLGPSEHIFFTQSNNLKGEDARLLERIEFMTYAKVHAIRPRFNNPYNILYDFIILDEFHRIGAESWGESVIELIDLNFSNKIIGLSATHIRFLDNGRDMCEEIFGNVIASKITITEAIQKKILPSPNYVVGLYSTQVLLDDLEKKVDRISDYEIREKKKELCKKLRRKLEDANGIDEIFNRHISNRQGKYLVFCMNITHLYTMIAQVPLWFKDIDRHPHVYCITCKNISSQKELLHFMQDESEHIKLLFCVDMLNEGVHISGTDGVILLRPTNSPIVFLQQIGRALAIGESDEPVIFDLVNNIYTLSKNRRFYNEYFTSSKEYNLAEDLELDFNITDELAEYRDLIDKIESSCFTTWDEYYSAFKKMYLDGRNVDLPAGYVTEDGLALGKWVFSQRYYAKAGKLSEKKEKLLNDLNFCWESSGKITYNFWISELKKYKEINGDINVPAEYKTDEGIALGHWLRHIRTSYNSQTQSIPENYIKELEELGISWNVHEQRWMSAYQHAKEYFIEFGNLNVPCSYVCKDGFKLGEWISIQKGIYRGSSKGAKSEDHLRLLNKIGFSLERNTQLKGPLDELDKYYDTYGNLDIPREYITDSGFKLGRWVRRQKEYYVSGAMSKQRAVLLYEHHMDEWGVVLDDLV